MLFKSNVVPNADTLNLHKTKFEIKDEKPLSSNNIPENNNCGTKIKGATDIAILASFTILEINIPKLDAEIIVIVEIIKKSKYGLIIKLSLGNSTNIA